MLPRNRFLGFAAIGTVSIAIAAFFLFADDGTRPGMPGAASVKSPTAMRQAPPKAPRAAPLKAPPKAARAAPPLLSVPASHPVWKRIRWFDHGSGPVTVARASEDGRIMVTGGEDGRVILWQAETGRQTRILIRYPFQVGALAISPDGKQVASVGPGSADPRVSLWDVATGKRRLLEGHRKSVKSLAFSPDGKVLASGSIDDTVRFWSATTGRSIKILKRDGKEMSVGDVRFSPDGRWLAVTPVFGNEVLLWDVATGTLRHTLRHRKRIPLVVFGPRGKVIATASDDETAAIWSLETGKSIHRLEGHRGGVWSLAFSPDARLLASVAPDATARIWGVADGKLLRRLEAEKETRFRGLIFGPRGRELIVSEGDALTWWEVATGKKIRTVPSGRYTRLTRVGRDRLLGRTYLGRIRLWETATGKPLHSFDGHTYRMTTVGLSADGRYLATGGYDNVARVWETESGKRLFTTEQHKGRVSRLSWTILSPDGRLLATLAAVSTVIHIWDAATGKKLRSISGPEDGYQSIAFGPKGRTLFAGADDETVRLYDVATGEERGVLRSPNTHIIGPVVAVGPKGLLVAAGFARGEVRIWAVDGGKLLHSIKDTHAIAEIAFSPDGRLLATATSGGHVRIYDVISGRSRHRLKPDKSDISTVAFSRDGRTLAVGGRDAAVRFIDVGTGAVRASVKTLRWIRALRFTPDGRSIVVANDEAGVFLLSKTGAAGVKSPAPKPPARP